MTTTPALTVGDRVCRRNLRRKVVGTVTYVGERTARVDWDKTRDGLVRIGSGRGIDSSVRISDLCREAEYVANPLSGPVETDWKLTFYSVKSDHPSGQRLNEYDVNLFTLPDEAAARAKAAELIAAGRTNVTVSYQERASWVPKGCRVARDKWRWTDVTI